MSNLGFTQKFLYMSKQQVDLLFSHYGIYFSHKQATFDISYALEQYSVLLPECNVIKHTKTATQTYLWFLVSDDYTIHDVRLGKKDGVPLEKIEADVFMAEDHRSLAVGLLTDESMPASSMASAKMTNLTISYNLLPKISKGTPLPSYTVRIVLSYYVALGTDVLIGKATVEVKTNRGDVLLNTHERYKINLAKKMR